MDENNLYSPENNCADDENTVKDNADTALSEIPVVRNDSAPPFLKIAVIMCVVCTIIGAIVGGIVAGVIVSRNNDNSRDVISDVVDETTTQNTTTTEKETATKEEKTTKSSAVAETTTIMSGTVTSSDDKPSVEKTYSAKDIYANNVESVVGIEVRIGNSTASGTGFIISEEGYIVTNYHVVSGADSYVVTLHNKKSYNATLVGYEDSNDIAVLKIEPKGKIQSVIYGESSALEVGDSVYVIGNPLGDLTYTLTDGIVSALNRLITTDDLNVINMFQTNAAINSGNSGGPVFDEHGYVVGIACAKYAASSIEGLSFCIPIDDVRSMIDEIINIGYVSGQASLGVSVCDKEVVSYGFIQTYRSITGAKIVAVGSGTCAEKYGLQAGDVITAVGSEPVTSVSELKTILSNYRSDDVTIIKFTRNGAEQSVTLILDEYSPAEARTNYSYVYDL
ncbi:MAG: trypsin-like peptidase domain-containing protein [Clostridia bacterium]|nr:trypsin-like peptidase domain-containing protein [Clostridia bacterium]